MNITETVSYDKEGHIERWPHFRRLFPTLIVLLVAFLSFGLGRLSVVGNREPIRIEYDESMTNVQIPMSNENSKLKIENSASVITSRNGSKYHYPHCSGAKQIKEENKVIFASAQSAEAAGYTLAANCEPK